MTRSDPARIDRPDGLFDREDEWQDLVDFARSDETKPQIGLVYGRRRQGKSFMLGHLVRAIGGLRIQALEETRGAALGTFYRAVTEWSGQATLAEGRFRDWPTAIRALCEVAAGRLIVIDELPYLLADSKELPSVIQSAYDQAQEGGHPPFRMILCGSAISVMTTILTGDKALRGRTRLELAPESFDFRQTRAFWGIEDPDIAFRVDAIIGGAPGYRDLLDAPPKSRSEFDRWTLKGPLNPSHALFREAEYLMSEDPSMTDRALYRSIVASIAAGNTTKGKIGTDLGRDDGSLGYPLQQLERARFITRRHDLLRPNRPLLRIADPVLRFHFAIVRPDADRYKERQGVQAWADAAQRFSSAVIGPHFEEMARTWTRRYASKETLGGTAGRVGFVQVNDPAERRSLELDVAVSPAGSQERLLAIGEAKARTGPRSVKDIERLERLRGLLASRIDTTGTKLLLFSSSGFERDVIEKANGRSDIEVVDLQRMYGGA
jgi:uncharacterized protein